MLKPWTFPAACILVSVVFWISPQAIGATIAPSSVQNIQWLTTDNSTRVIIEMDSDARYEQARIANPDRIYFDIFNAQLSREFLKRTIPVKNEVLKQIRVAQNRADLVRVVLDVAGTGNFSVSQLNNPFRIVLDLHAPSSANAGANPLLQSSASIPAQPESKTAAPPPPSGAAAELNSQEPSTSTEGSVIAEAAQIIGTMPQSSPVSVAEVNTFTPAAEGSAQLSSSIPLAPAAS